MTGISRVSTRKDQRHEQQNHDNNGNTTTSKFSSNLGTHITDISADDEIYTTVTVIFKPYTVFIINYIFIHPQSDI